jgi:hypothetical protein
MGGVCAPGVRKAWLRRAGAIRTVAVKVGEQDGTDCIAAEVYLYSNP